MKNITFFLLLLLVSQFATAQAIYGGWYYLPQPAGNLWGIAFHEPKAGNDLSPVGSQLTIHEDSDIIILPGPKSSDRVFTKLNDLVATSLFHNDKNISYHISSYKIKQLVLRDNKYADFGNGSYYVTQALSADSVVIKGKITRKTGGNSSDAEKMIAAYAGGATVAFQVVNTLTGKDTSKQTGIVSFSQTKDDSFTIVVTDPDIFFAVRLTKVKNDDNRGRIVQRGLTGGSFPVDVDSYPTEIVSLHYQINKGLDVGIRFSVANGTGIAEVYQQFAGKGETIVASTKKKIEGTTKFKIDGSTTTPMESMKRNKAHNYLVYLYSSFSFDPKTNKVKIEENNGGLFKTAIEHVESVYTNWPR